MSDARWVVIYLMVVMVGVLVHQSYRESSVRACKMSAMQSGKSVDEIERLCN